jgi:hypothetical protein
VGAAFARRAVSACNDAKALKDAQGPFPYPDFNPTEPDPTKFPGVADALMKTDVTFTTWLEEMRALGEPPSGNEAWAALLDAIKAHVRINRDQINAAREGHRAVRCRLRRGRSDARGVARRGDRCGRPRVRQGRSMTGR